MILIPKPKALVIPESSTGEAELVTTFRVVDGGLQVVAIDGQPVEDPVNPRNAFLDGVEAEAEAAQETTPFE